MTSNLLQNMNQTKPSIDPKSGFNSLTKTFHSLKPPLDLPPEDTPISAAQYSLSFQPKPNSVALIDSSTGQLIFYSEFIKQVNSLASYLQLVAKLSKNDTAFILSSNSIKVPILYFALLSLGVIISPANPANTESEISRLVHLSKPGTAFATSSAAHKLPGVLKCRTILIDSPEFESAMTFQEIHRVDQVSQSDVAAIMFSSGTTGKTKGVMLTHRNLIAAAAGHCSSREQRESPAVVMLTVPFFHVYGFLYCVKSVLLREAVVVMERFDLQKMLRAVEEFRVTSLAAVPPVVVAMVKNGLTDGYDLRSLKDVGSGGAPLGKDVIRAFTGKFPTVALWQGYAMTESTAVFSRQSAEEVLEFSSVGRFLGSFEAKIVDPVTGDALPPGKQGELWIRGPTIMKGYVSDHGATSATLISDGWLRTGDICYINEEGFVFVVDRLKELIKYKGYQVPPAELEQLLQSHSGIADAAVIPYPDEEAGQVPVAFVVKQPHSNLNETDVMKFVAAQVAPYKKIRHVVFVNSVPRSPAGKLLRKDLQKIDFSRPSSRM